MLNGIEDLATRSDVQDRAVSLTLPEIPDERRRDEDELWRRYELAKPRLLGALLTAVNVALRNLAQVSLPSKPRMADFALWAALSASARATATGATPQRVQQVRHRSTIPHPLNTPVRPPRCRG
jgi:hypothetical protein